MPLIKRKKFGRWILLSAIIVLLSVAFLGNFSLLQVHRETRSLQHQIQSLNLMLDSLSYEIRKLHSDTLYIEKIAREKLGMARKDEKVYKFIGKRQ